MKNTDEELRRRIQEFRPIDDTFFEVLADDVEFCQEILRVILEDPGLVVESVTPQKSIRRLLNRSVRLDVLCTLGNGTETNIEVQRSDNDNHLKRIRYNAACITTSGMEPGEKFENVSNVIVVYITEFDFLKGGRTIYHIDKVVRETGEIVEDGMKTVCVNTKVNDGTDIAELMQCFMQREVNNPKFPAFTGRMNTLKHTERGYRSMCRVMEEYAKEYASDVLENYEEEKIKAALEKGKSPDDIADFLDVSIDRVLEIREGIEVCAE